MTESVRPESSEPLSPKTHFEIAQTAKQLADFIEESNGDMRTEANRHRQQMGIPEIPAQPGDSRSFKAKVPKDWMGRFFQVPGAGIVDDLTISIPGEKYPERVVIVDTEFAEDVPDSGEIPDDYTPPRKEVIIPLQEGEPTFSVAPGTFVTTDSGMREEAKLDELTGQDLLLDLQEILAYQTQAA